MHVGRVGVTIGVAFVDERVEIATLLEDVDCLGQQGGIVGALGGQRGLRVVHGSDGVGHCDGRGAGVGGVGRHGCSEEGLLSSGVDVLMLRKSGGRSTTKQQQPGEAK